MIIGPGVHLDRGYSKPNLSHDNSVMYHDKRAAGRIGVTQEAPTCFTMYAFVLRMIKMQ